MNEYLRSHPNIFMSRLKEPGFFAQDIEVPWCRTIDAYMRLFERASPHHVIIGEASVKYLCTAVGLRKLRAFQPTAKLLVMLRPPFDLVYAFHSEMVKIGVENEWDFEKAWNLQATRTRGNAVPPAAKKREKLLQYKWIGSLGSQVKSLLEIYPKNQVLFLLFEDFITNPRSQYLTLLDFLGVPDDGRRHFPKINENVRFKSQRLARTLRNIRGRVFEPWMAFKRATGFPPLRLIQTIDRFNSLNRARPPLRNDFRHYLIDTFRDEVQLLEELVGRDLTAWRQ